MLLSFGWQNDGKGWLLCNYLDESMIVGIVGLGLIGGSAAKAFKLAGHTIYAFDISLAGEIIDLGVEAGVIKKAGAWFSYNDTKLGQGRDAAKRLVQDNPELLEELQTKIMEALKGDK